MSVLCFRQDPETEVMSDICDKRRKKAFRVRKLIIIVSWPLNFNISFLAFLVFLKIHKKIKLYVQFCLFMNTLSYSSIKY